jgi:DNA-binding CsgD family transcriptional regulator
VRVRQADRELLNVIDALYEGMLDESAWNPALVRMTDMVAGSAVALFSLNPSTGEVFRADVARIDPHVMSEYQSTWINNDPRHAAALTCKVGEPQVDGMLVDVRGFHRSTIFNEFFRPSDIPFHIATWIERTPKRGVVLSIQGTWQRGAFDEEDRDRLALLIPHVRRIVAMKDRMARSQTQASGLLEMMDRLPYGVLLLGRDLEILEASAMARELLASRCGLHGDDGRLGFTRASDAHAFVERLKEDPARVRLDDTVIVSRAGLRAPLSLMVLPVKGTQEAWLRPTARWLVLVFDPEATRPIAERTLQQVLGISAAEAALARRLALGVTVAEAATQLGISIHTARSQLKSVFAKVGVRTQAQLVRRILNGPAALSFGDRPRP